MKFTPHHAIVLLLAVIAVILFVALVSDSSGLG